jgi:prepilin-type N-terminal cleavage/methylation domain-containing protein
VIERSDTTRNDGLARRDEGFTLPELMVVVALFFVIVLAAYFLMQAVMSSSSLIDARMKASDESWQSLDRMTRELRQATEIVEGQGVFIAGTVGPRACEFYSDIDHDERPEKVKYVIEGQSLVRYEAQHQASQIAPPWTFLAYGDRKVIVTTLTSPFYTAGTVFAYYNNADPRAVVAPADCAKVSLVVLRVYNQASVSGRVAEVDQTTEVKIRSVENAIQ